MDLEIFCKSCNKLFMVDVYEKFTDPKRFYSPLCGKCFDKKYELIGGK
jgi:hypothetical protein